MHAVGELGRQVAEGIAHKDGSAIARVFSLQASSTRRAVATVADPSVSVIQAMLYASRIPHAWNDVCIQYVRCGAMLFGPSARTRKPADSWHLAAEAIQSAVGIFLRVFSSLAPGRWAIPVLRALLADLRWVSRCADDAANAASRESRTSHAHLEECARLLNKAFTACIADRHPVLEQSKKWGTYAMVGIVFATYFQLKSIALCKNIVRALGAGDLPPLDAFPRAQAVTFRYYMGRLAFMDEDYARAEAELSRALADTPRSAKTHVERILVYLIPVRLLHAQHPTAAFLDEYPRIRAAYAPLISACKRGNVRAFDAALQDPTLERSLVRLGVYLAMERARDVCITRLVRRVWRQQGGGTRVRLAPVGTALQWLNCASDAHGAEWLVATQIARGRIKGYIAHERQMMVLSATEPFPHASLTML